MRFDRRCLVQALLVQGLWLRSFHGAILDFIDPAARIQIQQVEPLVDCGRYRVKSTVGDPVDVYATIFKDGHDALGAAIPACAGRATRPGARSR